MTPDSHTGFFSPATRRMLPLCVLLLSAGLAWSAPSSAPRGGIAVLEQPALISPKAAHQAMLSVARAGKRLVAVGEQGIVLLSDDDGASWRQARAPVSVSLTAVRFVDERLGWAAGHLGVVLHTNDGGETWIKQLDGVAAAALVLKAAEARHADLAAGEKTRAGEVPAAEAGQAVAGEATAGEPAAADREQAAKAAERALRDARRLVEEGPDKPFLDVFVLDARTGYVMGAYNLIFRTDDGGQTWRPWQDRVPNPDGFHLYGMAAAEGVLLVVGEQGTLLRSTDGGEHFEALESPYEGSFFGVIAEPGGRFVAYGLRGHAFRSDDGGETWTEIETGQSETLSAATRLADGSLALVSQVGEVLLSRDAGQRFQPVPGLPALPLAGIVQAADGAVVGASLMGPQRLGGIPGPR